MPTYVYKREDGTTFEIQQRITEDALEVCPETGQTVKRVITGGTGLIFKGDGFYLTDYVRNGSNGDGTKSPNGKDEATSSNDETKSASPTETSGSSDASTSSESPTA
jgi:putative FmdB family regulatory protein